ncbi:hypothetical protein NL676_021405 [Syzygium grande]|nr:hypothetical protein NL676_021405 [Syzygium grande]
MMTTNTLTSSFTAAPCDRIYGFSDRFGLNVAKFCSRRCWGGRTLLFPRRTLRVSCQTDEKLIRRYSPFLEGTLLSSGGHLGSDDWQAVPDIWRSSAETYGDQIALVDPYHNPPSNITYNQLEQEILNFSEGLRVIGVKPDEKLALYADNSCRWLIADQGM